MSQALSTAVLMKEDQTAWYYRIEARDLVQTVQTLKEEGKNLISIFGVEEFEGEAGCCLLYVFEEPGSEKILVLILMQDSGSHRSISEIFPVASLFEREIADGFGLSFSGAFDTRRLFLHEAYPPGFNPLRKAVQNRPPTAEWGMPGEPYKFKTIEGSSVYQIPVGPVHAGIIEPGHFRFSVIGETIVNLEVRLGYLHRGLEKLAEGRTPDEVVRISESISGDESAVNACGFCMAVEQISGVTIPPRAEYIRGVILELERAYSLLSDLAGMVTDIAHPVSASRLTVLRERLQREADLLCGSRFLKGAICIGGVSDTISGQALEHLFKTAGEVEHEFDEVAQWVLSIPSVIDRFSTTGVVQPELIRSLALSGPVARASGSFADTRTDHPYGVYRERVPGQAGEQGGDVLARFSLKYQEIRASLRYIQELLVFIPDGPDDAEVQIRDGFALAAVESPRGMTLHWVYIRNGDIHRYKIRTASFCNWYAIEHAVIGNIVADFPVINKSMNLSYAGTDL
ncbi:NADH-quinone oxidoreductase subunit C [uncultured Methanospirillum sp.]|uniref:hydrogenase large subunit n=1 Tax=uncultured Methanospirillum sp. TaxID=262503 RepID=UPI0029C90734|nr:NADH-quinone oxidoreductase subunit C [uncultured Methanospirillum sp.]